MKNKYVEKVCKIGQGHACCRYLTIGPTGYECAKTTTLKSILDGRVKMKTITARGNNCKGKTIEGLRKFDI